ncbi:MAG: hypothetical protein ACHQ53_08225, partial [Polyangiales bacterium]
VKGAAAGTPGLWQALRSEGFSVVQSFPDYTVWTRSADVTAQRHAGLPSQQGDAIGTSGPREVPDADSAP